MSENINNTAAETVNSTVDNITVMGAAAKRDYKKLPEVAYFRVQSRGAVGTLNSRADRKVGAWAVLVSCKDGKGLRLVSDVAYEHGMIVKSEFKTREAAIAAGKEYVAKWGKKTAKAKDAEKKAEAEKNALAMAALKKLAEQNGTTVEAVLEAFKPAA